MGNLAFSLAFIDQWLTNPEASATIAVAAVAGAWAIAQFRPVARERQRETFEAMTTHYVELRPDRDAALPTFPPLVAFGQKHLGDALTAVIGNPDIDTATKSHAIGLATDLRQWGRYGVAFTSARETIDSEAKFRSLLWAVESVRAWRTHSELVVDGHRYEPSVLQAAEDLAHNLNAFLFHYETGSYPARQTLGLLHRSLAVASKALEPVVWERSLSGRWGRRVLRIGIAAQHFNDVTEMHCTDNLQWRSEAGEVLIHPRLKRLVLGASFLAADSPTIPRLLPGVQMKLLAWHWHAVGRMSLAPRAWFVSYGGRRLRRHRAHENELAGLLDVALARRTIETPRPSLDPSWDLAGLKREQRDRVRRNRRTRGRFGWLWLPRGGGEPL
jgi:hypothetical protein